MKVKFQKEGIKEVSRKLLSQIIKYKKGQAKVVALSGDLGAGKTTLTQALALDLGIKNRVISPTFVIMKIYPLNAKSIYYKHFKKLIHIDAYRLESASELLKIGWESLLADEDNLILIEWPEKVIECLNKDIFRVNIEHIDEKTRLCEF